MRNSGFTLIELLAVIVILAVIALIAMPIILNIIKDSKEESNKRSVDMYASALKNAIAKNQLGGQELEISKLKVDYNGDVDCKTVEIYKDGSIYLAECKVNKEEINYTYGKDQSYDNGQIVYFDVEKGKSCTNYHEDNSKTGYNGLKNKDKEGNIKERLNSQTSCLKFYAFLDDESDKINLLLDHNTTALVAWTSTEITTNIEGPNNVIQRLYEDTKQWSEHIIVPVDYTMDQRERESKAYYTIEYSRPIEGETKPFKSRLITAQEIAQITGIDKDQNIKWQEGSSYYWYFIDGTNGAWHTQVSSSSNKSKYYWLFDRTDGCSIYGCETEDMFTYGYWTSSSVSGKNLYSWRVSGSGKMNCTEVNNANNFGVRPVITVLKSTILN